VIMRGNVIGKKACRCNVSLIIANSNVVGVPQAVLALHPARIRSCQP
jgi:hypothetical protein